MSTATGKKPALAATGEYVRAYIRKADDNIKFGIVLSGILFIAAAAYLSIAVGWPKFSRAEVFFAECVREMIQTDNLVTPLYHGVPFFDKPILSYWQILCSYNIFGISHWAARIPSIICALGTIAATAFGTKILFGPRAGTLAAAVLASAFMFLSFSNLCMSDMGLVFFDTLTLTLLFAATDCAGRARNERSPQDGKLSAATKANVLYWTAALSAGLAFLTKGPVGIVLPGISYVAYLTLSKQWNVIRPLTHVLPCLTIMTLATVPWFFAACRENGAGALTYFFIRENVQRFAGSTYDTHRPIWFMVTSLLSGFLPWSIFLPFAFKRSMEHWRAGLTSAEGKKHLYLWLWIATVTLFFSCSRGKIDYYVLPVYPAAAALVGIYLTEATDRNSTFSKVIAIAAGLIFTIGGAAAFAIFPAVSGLSNPFDWFMTPLVLTAGGLGMLWCVKQQELRKAYKLVFVTICVTAVAIATQLFPWISARQAILAYVPVMKAAPESTRIGVHCAMQNWIDEVLFQTGKEAIPLKDAAMAGRLLSAPAAALVIIPEAEFNTLPQALRDKVKVVDSRPFIARSLNPGYFLTHMGKISEKRLLLVENPGAAPTDE
ncbi:MAG: glycosyltransferase family 39 protein [Candidatus Obscuribacterales bacterium]|nr:glycosyltransferase family 39 protein [Candidatus Obscuribacterales bacterium]